VMQVLLSGWEGKDRVVYQYDLVDFFDEQKGVSSMARTTGYTCTIIARQLMAGAFKYQGICPPELIGGLEGTFSNLLSEYQKRGIHLQEKITRNWSMPDTSPVLHQLIDLAFDLGASDAAVIPSRQIQVRDHLASKCTQPRCENYGQSFSCPPHVAGPAGFRDLNNKLPDALVIRLVIPAAMLLSWERFELGRVHHELVARLETAAVELGRVNSRAFAGGSCKEFFCQDHLSCQLVTGGSCRHPDLARPSLSGYGVDVFKLISSCGWQTHFKVEDLVNPRDSLAWVAGVILIG
jgi:predicted metal-binding protein